MAVCRTLEVRGLLMGDGTNYRLGPIRGLGVPDAKSYDVERGHADGDVGQNDYYRPRQLMVELSIGPPACPTVEAVLDAWDAFEVAWAKSNTDITFVHVVGARTWTFVGRPRGAVFDDSRIANGDPYARIQAAFTGLDPTRY